MTKEGNKKNQSHNETNTVTKEGDEKKMIEERAQWLHAVAPLAGVDPGSACGDSMATQPMCMPKLQSEHHPVRPPLTNMDELDQPSCVYPANLANRHTYQEGESSSFLVTAGMAPLVAAAMLGAAMVTYGYQRYSCEGE